MSPETAFGLAIAVLFLLVILRAAIRILPEYERGVLFRLGRVTGEPRGPGLILIIPIVDRLVRVSLRTVTLDIEPQDIITKDNVTVRVDAVTYFRVVDPNKAILEIEDFRFGTSQVAQTTLRSIIGQAELDELLMNRDEINRHLQQIIDSLTYAWGVKVTLVEVKDVELPTSMRRVMAKQAESERERRAKVIHARGEKEAAKTLAEAAALLENHPGAMQLRILSTMKEVSAEQSSTLIFPLPMEFLRFLDRFRPAGEEGAGGSGVAFGRGARWALSHHYPMARRSTCDRRLGRSLLLIQSPDEDPGGQVPPPPNVGGQRQPGGCKRGIEVDMAKQSHRRNLRLRHSGFLPNQFGLRHQRVVGQVHRQHPRRGEGGACALS